MAFFRHIDVNCKTVFIDKKHVADSVEATGKLAKKISAFIRENYEFFTQFDLVKIYYDNGQVEVSKILSSVFNSLLDNVKFRRVLPSDYRLFQVADLICTLQLLELKADRHELSKSEYAFFGDERTLRKNYLKVFKSKQLI